MTQKDTTKRTNRPGSFIPLLPSKESVYLPTSASNTPNQQSSSSSVPQLHKVLGVTNPIVAAMSCSADGILAYPAGCVVVLYDLTRDTQSYLISSSRKAIISLAWSPDGRYIVTGEQGHKPLVRVWEHSSLKELVSLSGHTHGIDYVSFHPDQSYLISVGAEHDKSVFIWFWRSHTKIGANNKTFKVNCMSVSEDGSFFVLVGLRTVRFCQFDAELSHRSRRVNSVVSRTAVLGAHQSLNYIAVCCSKSKLGVTANDRQTKTYVLSQRGIMLILNSEREVVSWFDTQIRQARCIAVTEHFCFCGGLNALIRIFEIPSFQYVACMPLAMSSETGDKNRIFLDENRCHPTALGLTLFCEKSILISSYSNHSIYIWGISRLLNTQLSIQDINESPELIQEQPKRTFLFHSSQIWAAEIYPSKLDYPCLPPCFLTGSSDGTVRIWRFSHTHGYVTPDSTSVDSINGFNCPELIHLFSPQDAVKEFHQDTASGIKCIKVSPDGLYVGAGERGGCVRIYNLRSKKQIYHIPVHTGEVLQVDFSPDIVNFPSLMASGGKDRTIQVYTIDDNFSHLQTISAHSGAVTCIQFYSKSAKDAVPTLYIISCATDRSIKLFLYSISNGLFEMKHHIVNNTSIYGMDIDSVKQRLAVAGQDKHVRFYSLDELSTRSIGKISGTGDEKGFSHLAFDPSGRYLVTSSVQKYVLLFDTFTKAFLSQVYGHSEMILSVKFSQDGRYFVSVGGDGCVFVWRLPNDVTHIIHKHIGYKGSPVETQNKGTENDLSLTPNCAISLSEEEPIPLATATPVSSEDTTSWVQTTISKLPPWAQRHLISHTDDQLTQRCLTPDTKSSKSEWGLPIPSGKWAQRAESMMNLTTPDNLLNTAMIDTSYSTLSTYSSYSTRGSRTVGDGEDSPISENQLFTPCIQHNGETPKFNPLRTVVGTGLKYRSTSLSVLYEQRRDDIAHASLQQQLLAKQSPIEERADIERIELELDISEDPLLDDSSVIVTGKELLSVSQPLASTLCDTSLMVATAVSRSTLCNSESDSDHTPTGSPSLIVKLRHQVSKSAIIERATSMQSLSSSNQLPERGEPIKPILSHPLSNASSMQQLNNLSPSLSPAGESKLFRRLDDSNTQFSFSTNNIAIVGTEKGLSRAFSRGGKGRKKLPNIPNSPMIYSVNKTTLETKETLGEKLRDNLDTFVTRTDGLTPELIVRAYPEYNSIVELAVKIVKGSMRSTSVGVCTEIDSEYSLVATEVSNNFVKLQELVNEMSNQFSLLK